MAAAGVATAAAMIRARGARRKPAEWRVAPGLSRSEAEADAEIAQLISLPGLQSVDAVLLARGSRDFHVIEAPDAAPAHWRVGATAPEEVPWRLRAGHLALELHAHLLDDPVGEIAMRVPAVFVVAVVSAGLVM